MSLFKRKPSPADGIGFGIASMILLGFLGCAAFVILVVWLLISFLFS